MVSIYIIRVLGMVRRRPELDEEEIRLLKIRSELNKRRPRKIRQESWRYVRVKESWRRPRGIDSKMRLKKKGYPPLVSIGYRGPKKVRGLHPTGFKEVLVFNPDDLDKIDPKREAVRIAGSVGRRKRMAIIEKADKLGIVVLNRRL